VILGQIRVLHPNEVELAGPRGLHLIGLIVTAPGEEAATTPLRLQQHCRQRQTCRGNTCHPK
jgi:hypothetical protein